VVIATDCLYLLTKAFIDFCEATTTAPTETSTLAPRLLELASVPAASGVSKKISLVSSSVYDRACTYREPPPNHQLRRLSLDTLPAHVPPLLADPTSVMFL
jgi:hypothetical protein